MQAMAAALSTPDDVILFFSYSGATKDMLDVLRPARRRGAKIILVTHFAKSPAAAMADVTLLGGAAAIRFRGCKDGSAVYHRRTVQ